jgi:HK97 family phage portal protein
VKIIEKAKRLLKSVTSAQVLPISQTGRAIRSEWDYENAIKHGYKRSATVYSCINLIAKSAASVEWKTYRRNRKGTWEEIADHPLTLLIEKPNPFMSQKDFIERMTHSLYLGGNAIFSKVRGTNNAVLELWYLTQNNIKPVPDQRDFISHYEYNAQGIKRNIPTRDIIHNQFLDPNNLFWGIAPIRAAAEIIDTDTEAIRWNRYSMQQRAISDGAFILDQPLTEDQWKEARQQIADQHTGSDNARSFWVLGAGAQWQPMSMTPAEMDFIESRKLNREEICSIFGVPPVMIGLYENATLANIETGRKIFWLDTILPYLADIRNCLNAALAAEYGADIKLDFDTSTIDAIQENVADKINNAKTLFSLGVPFNEINKKLDLGFDEIEGGQIGFLPSNLLPASLFSDGSGQAAAPEPQNEPPASNPDDPKGITAGKHKSLSETNMDAELKRREYFWKAAENRRLPYDMAMTRKAAAIFEEMAEKVSKAFAAGKDVDKAIDSFKKDWITLFELTYKQIFDDIGVAEVREILAQVNEKNFDPRSSRKAEEDNPEDTGEDLETIIDREVLKWITLTCASKVTGVLEFTKANIAALILGLEELYQEEDYSVHVDKVSKEIFNKFEDFSRYRAYRIARTEVAGAGNAAQHKGQQIAQLRIDPTAKKLILQRQWITSRDERVRKSHAALDGKIVDLDGKFKLWKENEEGELIETEDTISYPADYIADEPSNTINCRCTTKSIIVKA